MKLILDENLPPQVAAAIHALGICQAEHVLDYLPKSTSDEQVFAHVKKRGGCLLTQNWKIRRDPHQVKALHDSGIGAFFLTGRAQRDERETTIFLLTRLPEMSKLVGRTRPPFIFGIPDRGEIERLDH